MVTPLFLCIRFMNYVGCIPEGTHQQFLDRLAAFFEESGARLPPKMRIVQGAPWDLNTLFRLVAQQGGYQAVTATWCVQKFRSL